VYVSAFIVFVASFRNGIVKAYQIQVIEREESDGDKASNLSLLNSGGDFRLRAVLTLD
jgi:hypothetical protein